jgi:hypothetical protein
LSQRSGSDLTIRHDFEDGEGWRKEVRKGGREEARKGGSEEGETPFS